MEQTILKKKCPKCGKEISSLYQEQLDYNFDAHLISCKKKDSVCEKCKSKFIDVKKSEIVCRQCGHREKRYLE